MSKKTDFPFIQLDQTLLPKFISKLPKAELHIHLEGSLEPEQMMEFANRNGMELPFTEVEEVKKAYRFSCLQDFLDVYHQATTVFHTEQDFYDVAMAYLQKAHANNVLHAEIFVDLQTHTRRGDAAKKVIDGVYRAGCDAQKKMGISSAIIVTFLRHLSGKDALETLEEIKPYREKVVGIGLASSEKTNSIIEFKEAFLLAKQQGYRLTSHAGEENGPQDIWAALQELQVERIDHGVQSIQDESLMGYLAEKQIGLTVCPLSNLNLCVVPDLRHHMLKKMMNHGLKVTINSDDPAYFGGYINDNFIQTALALDLSAQEALQIAKNSFEVSFISPELKKTYLQSLLETVETFRSSFCS